MESLIQEFIYDIVETSPQYITMLPTSDEETNPFYYDNEYHEIVFSIRNGVVNQNFIRNLSEEHGVQMDAISDFTLALLHEIGHSVTFDIEQYQDEISERAIFALLPLESPYKYWKDYYNLPTEYNANAKLAEIISTNRDLVQAWDRILTHRREVTLRNEDLIK
jgi:hypothetical protein